VQPLAGLAGNCQKDQGLPSKTTEEINKQALLACWPSNNSKHSIFAKCFFFLTFIIFQNLKSRLDKLTCILGLNFFSGSHLKELTKQF
jgi:hypothetical protein